MTDQTHCDRMRRARAAQAAWATLAVRERCRRLRALRHQIADRSSEIVDVLSSDTGKTPLDGLSGDVLVTLEQLLYNEKHASRILTSRKVARSLLFFAGASFEESFEPHGVVLIYAPSNYPLQLSIIPAATALAAGNAVILKCSEKTPQTADLIARFFADAGFSEDLVQAVSDAPESASALIDAGPDMVFFTGSSRSGREVATRAAQRLIPAVLELGGLDPALAFADCNFKRTVEGVTYGAFANAGQVCVGIKRLYLEEPIFAAFLDALAERAGRLRIGGAKDCDLGLLPPGAARERFVAQVQDAINKGARLHFPQHDGITGNEPVILSHVPPHARLMTEEVFGPVVFASSFKDEAEAVAYANASDFALSCSVWTADLVRARRVAGQMSAGSCAVNDVVRNIANPHSSFGGNRQSGYGRYHGPQGLLAFSRSKSVMTMSGRSQRERHWFPFTAQTFGLVQKVIAFRHGKGSIIQRISQLIPVFSLVFLLYALPASPENLGHLYIDVKLPPNSHGDVAYLIFSGKDGFPNKKNKSVRGGFAPVVDARKQEVKIDAGALPPGRYAVSVYEDVNGNRKLDKNLLGIPAEPVGASNNPKERMGPPSFADCAFQFGQFDQTISITLVH